MEHGQLIPQLEIALHVAIASKDGLDLCRSGGPRFPVDECDKTFV